MGDVVHRPPYPVKDGSCRSRRFAAMGRPIAPRPKKARQPSSGTGGRDSEEAAAAGGAAGAADAAPGADDRARVGGRRAARRAPRRLNMRRIEGRSPALLVGGVNERAEAETLSCNEGGVDAELLSPLPLTPSVVVVERG